MINVTRRYGDRAVVDRLSLDVARSEVVALLGPSGCGKTTTLRLIAGLDVPDEGEILIDGQRVTADGRVLVLPGSRGIGFVFQDLALWPHMTIAESIEFVLGSEGLSGNDRKQRISEVLRLTHIEWFAGSYPAQLSGGEQQRAALARALAAHPRLLLLDEPMSNLDTHLKAELCRELSALQQMIGITTIYITHDRSEALSVAHRIATMNEGRIIKTEENPSILRDHNQ